MGDKSGMKCRMYRIAVLVIWMSCMLGCDNGDKPKNSKQSPDSSVQPDYPVVIQNVSILNFSEEKFEPKSVWVEDGRIVKISDEDIVLSDENGMEIDATGKFLIPGLADMHSHAQSEEEMTRYLAHGVTTIRIMHGSEEYLEKRNNYASGKKIGPRLVVASPIIDGVPPMSNEYISIRNEAEAKEWVQIFKDEGYDQIKLYSNLSLDSFVAAIDAAHEVGLKAVGHIPSLVTAEEAYAVGFDSSEHLLGLIAATQDGDPGFEGGVTTTEYYIRTMANTKPADSGPIAELAKANDVWLVPTMEMMRRLAATPDDWEDWGAEGRENEISQEIGEWWTNFIKDHTITKPDVFSLSEDAWNNVCEILKIAHQTGAKILVGTDYGVPYMYPGECVHNELVNFVEAGISNVDAIKAATVLPAIFMEQEGEFGTIEEGARADLVLLEKNPIEDIHAISQIVGVMVRGRWFDKGDLKTMRMTGTLPH